MNPYGAHTCNSDRRASAFQIDNDTDTTPICCASQAKCNINDKFYVKAMTAGVKNAYFKVFLDVSQKCDDKLAADKCPKDVCAMNANNKCSTSIPNAFDMMSAVGGGSKGDWAVVRKITVGCQASTAAATCTSQTGCRWKDKGEDSECDLKWNSELRLPREVPHRPLRLECQDATS